MRVALVGNQNCGKTTLFNSLTGMNQKIGNWPGVTIERESSLIKDTAHELMDLPGIYSMFPYSEEEKITRDYVLSKEVNLIINVLDVTCIERSLYLTTQLLECDIPVIVVLNMCDRLDKKGITIDVKRLSEELGVSVVKVSALKNIGIEELKLSIENVKVENKKIFSKDIEEKIELISKNIKDNKRFISVKVIEEESVIERMDEIIADQRYNYINSVMSKCCSFRKVAENFSDRLDKVFLNKWLALPIFAIIMFLIYYLSVGVVGSYTIDMFDGFIDFVNDKASELLTSMGASSWVISLLIDGIVSGVGSVLNFVPQLCIMFLCISILESSGYMSRISFFLDIIFKKFGLSGKTLIPFIVGSGCSVPGIMSTRIIENKSEREMSVVLTPFIPCSAKLPIIALFSSVFFPNKAGLFSASLYFLAIAVILVSALFLKRFLYKEETNTFISELPEYKVPNAKYALNDVFDKVFSFVKRAGSVILIASIIIWFSLSFSFKLEYGVKIDKSMLASIGKVFSWVMYPLLGELSWESTVSAIQGLIAKEQVVSSMTIIANMSDSNLLFESNAFSFFTGASAYAYVVFNLFCAPCFGAIGTMRKELGSVKKTIFAVTLQCFVAWIISTIVYIIGTLIIGG